MSNPLPNPPMQGVPRDFGTHVTWFPCDPTRFQGVKNGLQCLGWGKIFEISMFIIPFFIAAYFWSQPVLRAHCRNVGEVIWVMSESFMDISNPKTTNQMDMEKLVQEHLNSPENEALLEKLEGAINGLATPVTLSAFALLLLLLCAMGILKLVGYILCAGVPSDLIPNGVFLALAPIIMGVAASICNSMPVLGMISGVLPIIGIYLHFRFIRLVAQIFESPRLAQRTNFLWSLTVLYIILQFIAFFSGIAWWTTTSPSTVRIASFACYTSIFMYLGIWCWTQIYYICTVRYVARAIGRMTRYWFGEESKISS